MEDNIIQTIDATEYNTKVENQNSFQKQSQTQPKKLSSSLAGLVIGLCLVSIIFTGAMGAFLYGQNRQIISIKDQLAKINTQLGLAKDASTKQAESSTEIQNKLNNINTTPKSGSGSNVPNNVTSFNNLSK